MNDIKMKTSRFLSVDLPIDSVIERAEKIKAEGFDAVEPISLSNLWDEDIAILNARKLKDKLDELELGCSCYSIAVNMLTDADARKKLRRVVDIANVLGAPYLHHTMQLSLSYKDLPVYQNVEPKFVEISRETAEYAGEKGMECIYEDQGFLINTPERLDSLMTKVAMPNIGVCLDVGNSLFYDIEPEVYACKFAPYIKNVHIKDYLRKDTFSGFDRGWYRTVLGNYLHECPVGHGAVNFEKVITILLENGYNGYFSLENHGHHDSNIGVKLSMRNLKYYFDRAVENINLNRL